jgi:FixJ family two-component response regulator
MTIGPNQAMEGKNNPGICIFVVEDDPGMTMLYRELLASIGIAARFFASGEEFFSAWSAEWRGGLLIDLRMPGMGGIEVLRRLRAMDSHLPAIVVTGHGEIRSAVQAMKLGAIEFIEKPFTNSELIDAVHAMLEKGHQQEATHALRLEFEACLAKLSAREREVAELIARGLTSRDIGALLSVSPRTVDAHRASILVKLNCASSVELAAFLSRFSTRQ